MRFQPVSMCLMILSFLLLSGCCDDQASIEEQNKATCVRVHAELANGNLGIFDEVLADNYVRHCQAMPPEHQELHGTEVFKAFLADFVGAVPVYTDTVTNLVAEGNMVAYVSTMNGIQTGPMGDLPASGKEFTLVNMVMHRFENGKIAETWVSWDNVAFLTQLGFFPPPAPDQP